MAYKFLEKAQMSKYWHIYVGSGLWCLGSLTYEISFRMTQLQLTLVGLKSWTCMKYNMVVQCRITEILNRQTQARRRAWIG
jgi:hypothetical protein